jgi:hypothetical protein
VIAGTATAVSNRVSRRQGNRWAAQEQEQYPPQQAYAPAPVAPAPPPADSGADRLEDLKQLGELKAAGVLTEAEFEAEKARILAS